MGEHWGVPLVQAQVEQGPCGFQSEPSSYSTSSTTQAAGGREGEREREVVFMLGCTSACTWVLTFADRTADERIYNRVGAFGGRALLFPTNNTAALQHTQKKKAQHEQKRGIATFQHPRRGNS